MGNVLNYPKNQMKNQKNKYNIIALFIAVVVIGGFYLYQQNAENKVKPLNSSANEVLKKNIPIIRVAYLIPSDKSFNKKFYSNLNKAMTSLQKTYLEDVEGAFTFKLSYYNLKKDSLFFQGDKSDGEFWGRSLTEGFSVTGGFFNDPNNRWIYFIDAKPLPNQYIGGTSGVALLADGDVLGISQQLNGRWVGGLGHEMGHALTLPHPFDCPGASHCITDLMYLGYLIYPSNSTGRVGLTLSDVTTLRRSPAVSQFFFPERIDSPVLSSQNTDFRDPANYQPVVEDALIQN